jgi:hypothetical protein
MTTDTLGLHQSIILDNCWVCSQRHGLNDHHVIPQAYGGVDGPQVTLCASHHTLIHTVALQKKAAWATACGESHTHEQTQKLLQLVAIIAKARAATRHLAKPLQIQHKFTTERGVKIRELKIMLRCSSLAGTLDSLVDLVYAQCTQLKPDSKENKKC